MISVSAQRRPGAAPVLSVPAQVARALIAIENGALALVFTATVALPLVEIVLRALFGVGIQGVAPLTQNLTLALGMMGAAVAVREERLLTLAVTSLFKGRVAIAARYASGTIAAAVASLLMLAAVEFVSIERGGGSLLAYGIPVWIAELPLPLGFGLIASRLGWNAAASPAGRFAAAALAVTAVAAVRLAPFDPAQLLIPALAVLGVATFLGAPIFITIGGAALFLLLAQGNPAASVAVGHYSLVINPSLPAIPMFTLAGYLLAESGAPRRLIEAFDALFGKARGGAAIVTVLACTFFTSSTGASGVTILALGGLVMPLLLATRFAPRPALGLVTAAGLPGTLLMPALPLILYAMVAGVGIEDMFVGGALPTLLMVGILVIWGVLRQPARSCSDARPFEWRRAGKALARAKWELSLPLVPILALASGLTTPVEASAITALYALLIAAVIHRDLGLFRDVPRVIAECGLIVGGILLILGVALGLTDYLVDAQTPERVIAWVMHALSSRYTFLLVLNAFLVVAGCVMEIYPAIVILVPMITRIGAAFDIHPVHLGVIFLANMELGYLTPLVGLNLFFAAYRFGKPIPEIFRAVLPLFVALGAGVLIVTYVPWLSTRLLRSHH